MTLREAYEIWAGRRDAFKSRPPIEIDSPEFDAVMDLMSTGVDVDMGEVLDYSRSLAHGLLERMAGWDPESDRDLESLISAWFADAVMVGVICGTGDVE